MTTDKIVIILLGIIGVMAFLTIAVIANFGVIIGVGNMVGISLGACGGAFRENIAGAVRRRRLGRLEKRGRKIAKRSLGADGARAIGKDTAIGVAAAARSGRTESNLVSL